MWPPARVGAAWRIRSAAHARKVDIAHGVLRISAAFAAAPSVARLVRPETRAPRCARRAADISTASRGRPANCTWGRGATSAGPAPVNPLLPARKVTASISEALWERTAPRGSSRPDASCKSSQESARFFPILYSTGSCSTRAGPPAGPVPPYRACADRGRVAAKSGGAATLSVTDHTS